MISFEQISYHSFLTLLHTYGFPFPEQLASLNAHRDGVDLDRLRHQLAPREPAQRREAKIAQYKAEKQVRTNLEAALGGGEAVSLAGSPLPAIAALLRATSSSSESSQGGSSSSTSVNPGIHDNVRQTTILLLQYLCVFTAAALSTIAQELELLQGVLGQAHIEEELEEHREKQREEERLRQEGKGKQERDGDSTWRLDAPMRMLGRGPKAHLIDERGKVSCGPRRQSAVLRVTDRLLPCSRVASQHNLSRSYPPKDFKTCPTEQECKPKSFEAHIDCRQ